MYVHEEIMEALGKIQRKHGLDKAETVAETGQAIHIMLLLNEPDIGAMLDSLRARPLEEVAA